ncbi:MAG: dihydropteroate synthase [Cytophagales bacterium]|nr:dihydropteroate synthase [Cytophagales bacterium]
MYPAKNIYTLNLGGDILLIDKPLVMGILNITPDSFYDGGLHDTHTKILTHTEKMLSDGAAIIDVGAYSSRPGSSEVTVENEMSRLKPVLQLLKKKFPSIKISVDTFRSQVANMAVNEGACMINDISGGAMDSDMLPTMARIKVPYVLMHMRGTPHNMTGMTDYQNIVAEIMQYFAQKTDALKKHGIYDIIIDPGIGFAKNIEQNFHILKNLSYFNELGLPLMVGISRKSFIYKTLDTDSLHALNGTTSMHTSALMQGAQILRVHDVKEAVETVKLVQKLNIN